MSGPRSATELKTPCWYALRISKSRPSVRGTDALPLSAREGWCARQDLNLHCTRSERVASCRWATGALVPAPRDRTWDLPLTGRLLCRLSYAGKKSQTGRGAASAQGGNERSNNGSRNRARRRWPNLDVHDVKQQRSPPRDRPRQKSSSGRLIADSWPRASGRIRARSQRAQTPVRAQTRIQPFGSGTCESVAGHLGPSCLSAEGFGPPPVIPVVSIPAGSDCATSTAPPRARLDRRRVVGTTRRRWR